MKAPLTALIPVADGVEEIETVTLIDVLRRAKINVTVASIEHDLTVTCAHDSKLTADAPWKEAAKDEYQLIVLPGGAQGAAALAKNKQLIEKLKTQRSNRRWYAALCASPALVFAPNGLLDGKRATCYPSFKDQLPRYVEAPVVVDGHCVTGQGPAAAMAFALKLVELVAGEEKFRRIAAELLMPAAL